MDFPQKGIWLPDFGGMDQRHAVVELHRVDAELLARMVRIEKLCLAASAVLGAAALASRFVTFPAGLLTWANMSVHSAVATLACTLSLALSFAAESLIARILSRLLAIAVVLAASAEFGTSGGFWEGIDHPITPVYPAEFPGVIAAAFVLLGLALLVLQLDKGVGQHIADFLLIALGLVTLTLVSESLFRSLPVFGITESAGVSIGTVCALALMTFVAFGRRMEHGIFAILLGRSHGSRFARYLLPVLIALPILREMGRARFVARHVLPRHYAAATLASIAIMVSIMLLLGIAYYFRRLEAEVQHLSLRDELTGLYNLRGFRLLADQALRLAQRSKLPFSVLFIDLDDLKQVNDELGHGTGSKLLIETAELLRSTFRETDVVGRIGGDEFAVAGQFTKDAIAVAAERLMEKSAESDTYPGDAAQLRLSIGYVTTSQLMGESLHGLLDRADAAMYDHKKSKKLQAT